jgi:hypothetical protein
MYRLTLFGFTVILKKDKNKAHGKCVWLSPIACGCVRQKNIIEIVVASCMFEYYGTYWPEGSL